MERKDWLGRFGAMFTTAVVATVLHVETAGATTIVFNDFSNLAGLQLNGATGTIHSCDLSGDGATCSSVSDDLSRTVLRLTNGLGQSGSAFSTSAISLESDASFSTLFQFRISNPIGFSDADGVGADGIVFVVQTVSSTAGGGGGGIGYLGLPQSVGVEIDTWQNFEFGDIDGNHIGIDTGGNIFSLLVAPIAFPPRLNDGTDWFMWVDYDGATDRFEVRLAQTNNRPAAALLSLTLDLPTILGETDVFAGFTSGTGAAGGFHDIVSWEFRSIFAPIGQPSVPAPASLVLLGLGLLGAAVVRRRR